MAKKEMCMVFEPFELAPDVCDSCGKTSDGHPEKRPDVLPYKEAIWAYMLEHGGPYSYYGGYESWESKKIKDHLKNCGLDMEKMATPEMDSVSEFNGTFTDTELRVSVIQGTIICKCGEYEDSQYSFERQSWCVRDKTLSEVIWHVVKKGEYK